MARLAFAPSWSRRRRRLVAPSAESRCCCAQPCGVPRRVPGACQLAASAPRLHGTRSAPAPGQLRPPRQLPVAHMVARLPWPAPACCRPVPSRHVPHPCGEGEGYCSACCWYCLGCPSVWWALQGRCLATGPAQPLPHAPPHPCVHRMSTRTSRRRWGGTAECTKGRETTSYDSPGKKELCFFPTAGARCFR